MTKKQFEELLKALKGIEAALLALRVSNTVYVPQTQYVPTYTYDPAPNTSTPLPSSPITTCKKGHTEGFNGNFQVRL